MPIKITLNKARVPVYIWTDKESVESGALDQLSNTANLPFIFHHVSAMPDVHVGAGATIGSVIATEHAIVPSAVGVDIGCGMCAIKLNAEASNIAQNLVPIRSAIESAIPLGMNGNNRVGREVKDWSGWEDFGPEVPTSLQDRRRDAEVKLCSLGGGNHFIEISLDELGSPWAMLHSGSRNIGLRIADFFIAAAQRICKDRGLALPDRDLAYLPEDTVEFHHYLLAMSWAQRYAAENRRLMMNRVLATVGRFAAISPILSEMINCHHNFAQYEDHYGKRVLITRKGAIQAQAGMMGIIPGSMGTDSYIVRGLGNQESFHSASHGAGRKMSRSAAKKLFTLDDVKAQTDGVECRKDISIADELPGAYKDIDTVMANQEDLVAKVAKLKQILCVKG